MSNSSIENQIAAISPSLRVKISKRARKLALRLDSKDRVVNLVIPARTSLKRAYQFASSHKEWIETSLKRLPSLIGFNNGSVIPVFGHERTIEYSYNDTLKTTSINLIKNRIIVATNKENPESRIERYLKRIAKEEILKLAHAKAELLNIKTGNISIRDTKTRWGSCSEAGDLSFSWRLIFAPYESMDYVVAHEVAHIVHMNHSKEFWTLCEELCSDYKLGKKWMLSHGHELMRYGRVVDC